MKYIRPEPNPSGAYPAPQSGPAPGLVPISDALAADVVAYNGFVALTFAAGEVAAVTPNTQARESWKAGLPPAKSAPPTLEERTAALEAAMLAMMGGGSNG